MKENITVCGEGDQRLEESINNLFRKGWTLTWLACKLDGRFYAGMERETIMDNPEPKNEAEPERCGAVYHNKLRPCMVRYHERGQDKERRALFHRLTTMAYPVEPSPLQGGHPGGQISSPYAIVEYEDGMVEAVSLSRIRFLDTAHIMELHKW